MKRLLCALTMIAIPILANGDTLTLTNNSSLNGSVRYESGIFYVQADYKGGTEHYQIPRAQVTSDEINNETFNQGAPPQDIRAYQVPREEWVAVNSQVEPKVETRSVRRSIVSSEEIAGRTASIRETSKVAATNVSNVVSNSSFGEDMLMFTNNKTQIGTLRRMTAGIIIFRPNGQRSDTRYDRNRVKLIRVKNN